MKRLLVVIPLLAACQLIAGIDDREVSVCASALPPAPPSVSTTPDVAPVVFALDLSISQDPAKGFDLDQTCSDGTPERATCVKCVDSDLDNENGRDTGAVQFLNLPVVRLGLGLDNPKPTDTANDRFRLLAQLQRWNGSPNDDSIDVAFFRSHGRDESGLWTTVKDSFFANGSPMVVEAGFVRDGRVYMQLNQLELEYALPLEGSERIRIQLLDVVVMLPINDGRIEGGLISGRWSAPQLLASLSVIDDPASVGVKLCGTNASYATLRRAVCLTADIGTTAREDRSGKRCDALSVTFEVSGSQTSLGGTFTLPEPARGCPDSPPDDCRLSWEESGCR